MYFWIGRFLEAFKILLKTLQQRFTTLYPYVSGTGEWSPIGVMVDEIDCDTLVSKFGSQSHDYVLFKINTRGKNNFKKCWDYLFYDGLGVVWFNDISTIVGYLTPNPVFAYILNIRFVKTFWRYTVKWSNSSL